MLALLLALFCLDCRMGLVADADGTVRRVIVRHPDYVMLTERLEIGQKLRIVPRCEPLPGCFAALIGPDGKLK